MITELTVEHLALLTALERQAQSGTTDSQMLEALGSRDSCVLGRWQREQLQGYAIVARLPFEAELQAIGVLPEWRRSGVGFALMEAVLATAQGWSSERLLLEVRVGNLSAIQLYQRCGLSEDGRRKGYYPAQDPSFAQGCSSAQGSSIAQGSSFAQGCPAAKGATGREDALLMSLVL